MILSGIVKSVKKAGGEKKERSKNGEERVYNC